MGRSGGESFSSVLVGKVSQGVVRDIKKCCRPQRFCSYNKRYTSKVYQIQCLRKLHSAVLCPVSTIEHNMTSQLVAVSIARLSLHDPVHFSIQLSQTLHRLALLENWKIGAGSKVLEVGCGQGDCTTVLASAVGEEGRVVAVDPADLDYGKFLRLHSAACPRGASKRQATDVSCRFPIYTRPGPASYLAKPAG